MPSSSRLVSTATPSWATGSSTTSTPSSRSRRICCEGIPRVVGQEHFTWNILLAAFSKCGDMESALQMFEEMPVRDVVSWNTMISGYVAMGRADKAFGAFFQMQELGTRANGFTLSVAASCVSSAHQAKQIHGHAIRSYMDLSNVVLGNALIDMYGTLRLVDYACVVFLSMGVHDVTSQRVVVILSSISGLDPIELGAQIHSLVLKSGSETEIVIASSLLKIYVKWGAIESAMRTFSTMTTKDLVCWNTMILGYAENGSGVESLRIFEQLLKEGAQPDRITLTGALTACSLAEIVPQRAVELRGARSSSPYFVLARIYGARGKSGSVARVCKAMKARGVKKETKSNVYMVITDILSDKKTFQSVNHLPTVSATTGLHPRPQPPRRSPPPPHASTLHSFPSAAVRKRPCRAWPAHRRSRPRPATLPPPLRTARSWR